jgi:hypothetical protein
MVGELLELCCGPHLVVGTGYPESSTRPATCDWSTDHRWLYRVRTGTAFTIFSGDRICR